MRDQVERVRTLSREQLALLVQQVGDKREESSQSTQRSRMRASDPASPALTQHQLWSGMVVEYPQEVCIHQLFEAQVERQPDAIAVVTDNDQLTYWELNRRANQLAYHLRRLGIGPEAIVGTCIELSIETVIARLAIFKAGGVCVPLDPQSPQQHLVRVLEEAQVSVLLTQERLRRRLPTHRVQVVRVDADWEVVARVTVDNPVNKTIAENAAYLIYTYTAGSRNTRQGMLVSHRNVVNTFTGMDLCIGGDAADIVLAHTNIAADTAMADVFWTLTRGAKVVLLYEQAPDGVSHQSILPRPDKELQFSLFFFASDESAATADDKYRLLLEATKFADQHDFTAIWVPERHFHRFGGLYPNPSVLSAALAMITERIQLRAGSVVLPLHHPIRVAEEWSVVDNLSKGRVGLAFASGWNANDFVFAPDLHAHRKDVMYGHIRTVQQLWQGESIVALGGAGSETEVELFPKPIQCQLPIWLTSNANSNASPTTFIKAGEIGVNVLTALLQQTVEDVAKRIALYRHTLALHGHDPHAGQVTLMLHTFLGDDISVVREKVRDPLYHYLRTFTDLVERHVQSRGMALDSFTDDDRDALLSHVFERYFNTSALLGTPSTCLAMIERLRAIGVDELACLIDFGVDVDSVLESLHYLHALKERSTRKPVTRSDAWRQRVLQHQVSRMQCTATGLQQLMTAPVAHDVLTLLRTVIVSGEARPERRVAQAPQTCPPPLLTLYGKTETTGWLTAQRVDQDAPVVPHRRVLANTQLYLLDPHLQPVSIGASGELYSSGAGVPRGYHNRPGLTAATFLPNPFSNVPGDRLYKTGDRARCKPDAGLEFLGRIPPQEQGVQPPRASSQAKVATVT
jgi:natural product biosynthesis luciferase-like monooxygenase protein